MVSFGQKKVLSSLKRIAGKKKKTSKKINKKNTLNRHQSAFSALLSLAHTLSLSLNATTALIFKHRGQVSNTVCISTACC